MTNDELTIIVYTSLDQEYLTNLICLSTEFLKWFTMNFAGDSTAENDFLQSRIDIWESLIVLAEVIV